MIFPKRLKKGAHIRVIAPSRSLKIIGQDCRDIAKKRLEEMGFTVSYSKHAEEMDSFASSSINSRVEDLHDAFKDPKVDAILTAIGGFNSNQILDKIDYELIKKNPKIICGFSDITALTNAITAKTGLVTYSGAHFSTLGMLKGCEYTIEYFKKCLIEEEEFEIKDSNEWSDDAWFLDQENRTFIKNDGSWIVNKGKEEIVKGKIWGGNLSTISILFGTEYLPELKDNILFIENDSADDAVEYDRKLQSLIHQQGFETVKAVVFGRFQKGSKIDKETFLKIIQSKEKLKHLPMIADLDFGHSTPIFTFPIGGDAELTIENGKHKLKIIKH